LIWSGILSEIKIVSNLLPERGSNKVVHNLARAMRWKQTTGVAPFFIENKMSMLGLPAYTSIHAPEDATQQKCSYTEAN
jgi:hypothetical protein